MIAIGFMLFLGLWTVGCAVVSWLLSKLFPVSRWRPAVGIVLFVVLTSSLFIDEVIGNWQFQRLCRKQTVYIAPDAKGRNVYLADVPDKPLKSFWLRGRIARWRYVDVKTKKTIVSYNLLHWDGGWFMRAIKWNGGSSPLFYKGSCFPQNLPDRGDGFESLGINYIELPDPKNGRSQ